MFPLFRRVKPSQFACIHQKFATKVELDASLRQDFDSKVYKPRKHPGTTRIKVAAVPPDIQKALKLILDDNNAKSMHQESIHLDNYLRSRHLPPEDADIATKTSKIYNSVARKTYSKIKRELTEKEQEDVNTKIKTTVFNILKRNVYAWGNINYDKPTSLQYAMARAAPEYAVLVRVLDEIRKKLPDYRPQSFFDFGSGIGTGTWAVNTYYKENIFEYYCVDTSSDMHDLARLILCQGKENVALPLKGYFQRQFLPASTDLKYNIVLSAYSLFEPPDMKSRLETIQKLWNKTEDFLIIVENGSNAGFQIVNEAREFILNLPEGNNNGYAFSPCPNDSVCPRYLEQNTPCNFLMKYDPLGYMGKRDISAEVFSYVILKKGRRPDDDPQWPRVVRAPIVRSGHTICRLCTKKGELKEIVFSKGKFDQTTYRCARSCNWGDLLPFVDNEVE